MTSSEAARKNLRELKDKPLKDKIEHILSYYGFSIFVIAVFLAVGIGYLVHIITLKEEVLNVSCIGPVSIQSGTEDFTKAFAEYAGIDLDQYEVDISTGLSSAGNTPTGSYESVEVITAMTASQGIDILAAEIQFMLPHMYQNLFSDLRNILSKDQFEEYKDCFLYVDMEVVRQIKAMTMPENRPEYPNPTKPENMTEPVPVAIRLSESVSFVKQYFLKNEGHTAIAFAVNAKNLDNALAFLEFIHQ